MFAATKVRILDKGICSFLGDTVKLEEGRERERDQKDRADQPSFFERESVGSEMCSRPEAYPSGQSSWTSNSS